MPTKLCETCGHHKAEEDTPATFFCNYTGREIPKQDYFWRSVFPNCGEYAKETEPGTKMKDCTKCESRKITIIKEPPAIVYCGLTGCALSKIENSWKICESHCPKTEPEIKIESPYTMLTEIKKCLELGDKHWQALLDIRKILKNDTYTRTLFVNVTKIVTKALS